MSSIGFFLKVVALLAVSANGEQKPYQYSTFSGPVSGEAEEIMVPGTKRQGEETHSYDYVAKPDYSFAYGVEDPETGNSQKHIESREGDVVKGEYSIVEPDGSIRTVYYTADSKNGFQAKVERSAAPVTSPKPTPYFDGPTPKPTPYFDGPTPKPSPYFDGPTPPQPSPYYDGPTPKPSSYFDGPTPKASPYFDGPTQKPSPYFDGPTPKPSSYFDGPTPKASPYFDGPTQKPSPYYDGPTPPQPSPYFDGPTPKASPYFDGPTPKASPYFDGPTQPPTPYYDGPSDSDYYGSVQYPEYPDYHSPQRSYVSAENVEY